MKGEYGSEDELVKKVARMVSDWETSDELPTNFAVRVVKEVLAADEGQKGHQSETKHARSDG